MVSEKRLDLCNRCSARAKMVLGPFEVLEIYQRPTAMAAVEGRIRQDVAIIA